MLYVRAVCHGKFLYPGKYEKSGVKVIMREEKSGKLEMDRILLCKLKIFVFSGARWGLSW